MPKDIGEQALEALDDLFDKAQVDHADSMAITCAVLVAFCTDAARSLEGSTPAVRREFMTQCAEKAYDMFVWATNEMERQIRRESQ